MRQIEGSELSKTGEVLQSIITRPVILCLIPETISDYIPNELLVEILVRLPVQSLIRFTSVCKTWYFLITSPSFITKHLNHRSKTKPENLLLKAHTLDDNKERYLLCRGDEKFGDKFSEVGSPFEYKRIVGSCNGLVCVHGHSIMVWNPSTRKVVTLPMPSMFQSSGFSPRSYVLGFGAHPTTYEYMLVFIFYEHEDVEERIFSSKVELYTQGTGSWRCITPVGHPHHVPHDHCLRTFVNGTIHWIAFDRTAVDSFRNLIMLFNTGSQAFSVMMMPAALVNHNTGSLSMTLYGESLAVVCRGKRGEGSCCVWVMKEYGVAESWVKLYNITLPGVLGSIIGLRKNGEILLSTSENHLLCYNCETKTLTYSGYTGSSSLFAANTFTESLVLVEPGNGVF